jgi:hypothetical protein
MSLSDKTLEKVKAEGKPFFLYQDFQDAKAGKYEEIASRLEKRFRILVVTFTICIVFFSISSIHSFIIYLNTSLISSLVNSILWLFIVIAQTLLLLNYRTKIKRVSNWFISLSKES